MRGAMVTRAPAAITQRDLEVLRWVGEQYAMPMAVVAELVARDGALSASSAPRVAARLAARLERPGYADRRPLLGHQWLVPSRKGLRAAGLSYGVEVPAEILLRHVAQVGQLRLYLERTYPTATWESERAIRQRCAGIPLRRADGGLYWSDDASATAIELERYIKRPGRYLGVVTARDPAWNAGIWWFTPAGQVELLTARLRAAGGGELHQVYPLPPEVTW
jgi:hypothetical protein